ncbi:MAG: phage head closure protein [Mycobacterium sp.]
MAGGMRHRVTVQEMSRSSDGAGGGVDSWANIATNPTVYARVSPLSSAERVHAQQTDARATHTVTIRHRSDITASNRLVWGSRNLYPIGSWLNFDERGTMLTATCREDADG